VPKTHRACNTFEVEKPPDQMVGSDFCFFVACEAARHCREATEVQMLVGYAHVARVKLGT
jgi:hypothetical protein